MPDKIIAIDPGPTLSALVVWDGESINNKMHVENAEVLYNLQKWQNTVPLVIEMIGHYGTGMPAGKEVFETCIWIGRFMQAYSPTFTTRILRATIKTHICGSARAKDGNVRQAIIDRFGGKDVAIGKKANPGLLFGVSGDVWQALAVAITFHDKRRCGTFEDIKA